jgi:hypothetical protein
MNKLRTAFVLFSSGVRVFFTKGPATFIKMSGAKIRSMIIKRSNAEINEEYDYVSNPVFQITTKDLEASKKTTDAPKPKEIKTANWFIPYFTHAAYGGAYTMLRFVDYFQSQGVKNRVIIYDRDPKDEKIMRDKMSKTFPRLNECELIMFPGDQNKLKDLPDSDIAICTSWQSAYFLLKFNRTKRKYYFAMDYEPLFYPAGAVYALAESTYRFPFRAVVNTPGLLAAIHQRHGMEGISYTPAVDRRIYHYGLKDSITNVGLLHSLEEVAALYRTCDIGIVYMLTKHPSYQPFEYMASGMATVTNNNEDNLWLLKHEENCLVAEPSASAMAEQIERLVDDESLRQKIVKNGLKTVENEWDWQTDIIWNDIKHN